MQSNVMFCNTRHLCIFRSAYVIYLFMQAYLTLRVSMFDDVHVWENMQKLDIFGVHLDMCSQYVFFLKGWINIKVSGAATSRTNHGPSTCQSRKSLLMWEFTIAQKAKKTYALYSDHSGSESHVRRGFCLYINWSHNCHRIADKLRIQDQKQYHYDLHISASITFCSFGVLLFWLVSWLLLLCVYHRQASKGIKHKNVSSITFCLPMRPQPETYPRPIAMQSLSVTDVHIMVRFAFAINTWKICEHMIFACSKHGAGANKNRQSFPSAKDLGRPLLKSHGSCFHDMPHEFPRYISNMTCAKTCLHQWIFPIGKRVINITCYAPVKFGL